MAAHCDFRAALLDTSHRPSKDIPSCLFGQVHLFFQGQSPMHPSIKIHLLVGFEPLPIRKGCLHPSTEDICSLHQDCISPSYTYYSPWHNI